MTPRIISWIAQIAMAAILGQTLFFKLTYAPETRYIFARLGGRPGATFAAVVELACVVFLLVPRTAVWGAWLALAAMMGAVATHLLVVGVVIPDPATGKGDGGLLFGLALTVALLAAVVLVARRSEWLPLVRAQLARIGHP